MKNPTLTLLALLALTLAGCENPPKAGDEVLLSTSNWSVVKLNDSTVLCLPNSTVATPIVINTHGTASSCHGKGEDHDKEE